MTYKQIMQRAATLENDAGRALYTDEALLPHLNMALSELEEQFELNNIPVTNETSEIITIGAGTTALGFSTNPGLPEDLVEIQRLWESQTGQDIWVPIKRRDYLTQDLLATGTELSTFSVWAWIDQEIKLRSAIVDIDIKIDYIKSLFAELTLGSLGIENRVRNSDTYLYYQTAGLAAEYIGEDTDRATSLYVKAANAISRSLGISVKGQQIFGVRRRPFRAAFKRLRMTV